MRLAEAKVVGFGFDLPKDPSEIPVVAPMHRDLKSKFLNK